MENWFKKEIGDGVAAFLPSMEVSELYIELIMTGKDMSNVCVFLKHDTQRQMKTLYFTPEAEILAKLLSATHCKKPISIEKLSLLAGELPFTGK